jgi:hypothetical protein
LDEFYDVYNAAFNLFYPEAFTSLYNDIVTGELVLAKLAEQSPAHTPLEFVVTNRVGATVMLAYALGWERMNRLPRYFGNLFVPPTAVATLLAKLANVEKNFAEVPMIEFIQRADDAGSWGNCNEDVAFKLPSLLPSALQTVLTEGNGLLALNYPDVGSIPCFGYDGDRDW